MVRLSWLLLPAWFIAAGDIGRGEQEGSTPRFDTEGPAELLARGRSALAAQDFVEAEAALETFVREYSRAEEAREAVRLHRPWVALCKVAQGKFEEGLKWIDESFADPPVEAGLADELRFWRGLSLMNLGEWVPAQRAFGEYWAEKSHNPLKRQEALLLFAVLYLHQDFPAEAADFLESQGPRLREASTEVAGRAAVLELHARLQAEQFDQALAVVEREFPRLGEMTQVVSFQFLVLRLGATLLEKERYHEAIRCFQRIWPSRRLIDYQSAKIGEIEERIALLGAQPDSRAAVFQWRTVLERVRRELAHFQETEHFDSALRLRLATAFQELGRYRESALILEEMLADGASDPLGESAAHALVQCWMEEGHWSRAVAAADRYESIFGSEGPSLSSVLLLKAEALRELSDYGAAQLTYGSLVDRFPESPLTPTALFLQGFLYLLQDDIEGALYQFELVRRRHPDAAVAEEADYWTGMALSFAARHEEALAHFESYPQRWPRARFRKEAHFRQAFTLFSLARTGEAIEAFTSFLDSWPEDPLADEANLLLGDALFGEGRVEEGFAAYDRVRDDSGSYFEDAWFKKGKALRLLDELPAMREHFEAFASSHPESGRLPEAIHWIAWSHAQEEKVERARDIYWEAIETLGDDPRRYTVVDLLSGLAKVYPTGDPEAREDLLTKLQLLKSRAVVSDRKTLAVRVGWAKARILGGDRARVELLSLAKWIDPRRHDPCVSVAVAEAYLESGHHRLARELLTEIRRWHPRAVERDRIYRALGHLAAAEGEMERAIAWYERYERELVESVHLGEVRLMLAQIHAQSGRSQVAREIWEQGILSSERMAASVKAEALLQLGRSYAEEGQHRRALVYFERLYVAYGNFARLNAQAYWARGCSLEQLGLHREAMETYGELLARDDLRPFEESREAARRLEQLRRDHPVHEEEET